MEKNEVSRAECKFCEAMKANRQIEEISRSWMTDSERKQYGKYTVEYTVAIVKRSWYTKMGKSNSGRNTEYRYRGLGFKLNFCPECGRKLKGE